jgi:D-proline reductase (dithiol) PrdB
MIENNPMPADSVRYIDRTRDLYASQAPYRWALLDRETDPAPFTPIEGPLAQKRVVLISSGGVHLASQDPFHFRNDTSQREIPIDTPAADMRVAHFGYDTSDAKRDPACVLPLQALRALASDGEIGEVVDPALSFMGGIYSQRLVREEVAPRFRDFVLRERASLVLLVPV